MRSTSCGISPGGVVSSAVTRHQPGPRRGGTITASGTGTKRASKWPVTTCAAGGPASKRDSRRVGVEACAGEGPIRVAGGPLSGRMG